MYLLYLFPLCLASVALAATTQVLLEPNAAGTSLYASIGIGYLTHIGGKFLGLSNWQCTSCKQSSPLVQARRFIKVFDTRWDHFYAFNDDDVAWAIENLYIEESAPLTPPPGRFFTSQNTGTVPIYQCRRVSPTPPAVDHMLTLNRTECLRGPGCDCPPLGYVYDKNRCGAHPLYRGYSELHYDHFYTSDRGEIDRAEAYLNYVDEGITGYFL